MRSMLGSSRESKSSPHRFRVLFFLTSIVISLQTAFGRAVSLMPVVACRCDSKKVSTSSSKPCRSRLAHERPGLSWISSPISTYEEILAGVNLYSTLSSMPLDSTYRSSSSRIPS